MIAYAEKKELIANKRVTASKTNTGLDMFKQINMAVFFCYLVIIQLSSARYSTRVHWTRFQKHGHVFLFTLYLRSYDALHEVFLGPGVTTSSPKYPG